MAVLNICSAGDSLISVSTIYGGTINLFAVTLKRLGIECIFVSEEDSEEKIQAAIKPNTRLIFGETLANPAMCVFDIEKFAKIAHRNNIPLVVDNTFATPVLCRPFEFGADIVTHSTTKYMDGHALQVGGVIVDSGNFDWTNGKFPELTEPDESYHGVRYVHDFGKAAYITKARVQLMRDFGMYPGGPQRLFAQRGSGDAGGADGAVLPQCRDGGKTSAEVGYDRVGELSGAGRGQLPRSGDEISAKGCSGVMALTIKGGRDTAMKFMEQPEAGFQRGTRGGYPYLCTASGQ